MLFSKKRLSYNEAAAYSTTSLLIIYPKIVPLCISFFLIKMAKQFGSKTLEIWQIKFTEIEARP